MDHRPRRFSSPFPVSSSSSSSNLTIPPPPPSPPSPPTSSRPRPRANSLSTAIPPSLSSLSSFSPLLARYRTTLDTISTAALHECSLTPVCPYADPTSTCTSTSAFTSTYIIARRNPVHKPELVSLVDAARAYDQALLDLEFRFRRPRRPATRTTTTTTTTSTPHHNLSSSADALRASLSRAWAVLAVGAGWRVMRYADLCARARAAPAPAPPSRSPPEPQRAVWSEELGRAVDAPRALGEARAQRFWESVAGDVGRAGEAMREEARWAVGFVGRLGGGGRGEGPGGDDDDDDDDDEEENGGGGGCSGSCGRMSGALLAAGKASHDIDEEEEEDDDDDENDENDERPPPASRSWVQDFKVRMEGARPFGNTRLGVGPLAYKAQYQALKAFLRLRGGRAAEERQAWSSFHAYLDGVSKSPSTGLWLLKVKVETKRILAERRAQWQE